MVNVQALGDFGVKIFKQFASGAAHVLAYFMGKHLLDKIKLALNVVGSAAILVYLGYAPLEVDTAFYGAQNFVACAKNAFEKF